MVQDETIHSFPCLFQHTVSAFREHFRAHKSANMIRAKRWWAQLHFYCNEVDDNANLPLISCSCSRSGRQIQMRTKAAVGYGHKRSDWIMWLYPRFLEAFECYKRTRVKFSYHLLLELANIILLAPDSPYTIHSCDSKDNVLFMQKLIHSWGQ